MVTPPHLVRGAKDSWAECEARTTVAREVVAAKSAAINSKGTWQWQQGEISSERNWQWVGGGESKNG